MTAVPSPPRPAVRLPAGADNSAAPVEPASHAAGEVAPAPRRRKPLYTPEQRVRRDATRWTLVQGILAPIQFLVMLISVVLVVRYLTSGDGLTAANVSIVLKTFLLYTIMITGAIWEKVVFDQYLFHESFFWEDVVSFAVIALHTLYLWGLFADWSPRFNLTVALAAYAVYTVNAIQFILKLRAARLDEADAKARAALPSSAPQAGDGMPTAEAAG